MCVYVYIICIIHVQLLSRVQLFATPWIATRQSSLSITNSRNLLKLMSIESVMPSSHLILCHPLFLLPPIFPSIRVFSSETVLHISWPKYWSFSFSISPSNEYSGLISFYMSISIAQFFKEWSCSILYVYIYTYIYIYVIYTIFTSVLEISFCSFKDNIQEKSLY